MDRVDLTKMVRGKVDEFRGKNKETGRYEKGTGYGFATYSGGRCFFHISVATGFKVETLFSSGPFLEKKDLYDSEKREPEKGDLIVFEVTQGQKGLQAVWWAFADDYEKAKAQLETATEEHNRKGNEKERLEAIIKEFGWPTLTLSAQSFEWHGANYECRLERRDRGTVLVRRLLFEDHRDSQVEDVKSLPPGVDAYDIPEKNQPQGPTPTPRLTINKPEALQMLEEWLKPVPFGEWGVSVKVEAGALLSLGGTASEPQLADKKVVFSISHPIYGEDDCQAFLEPESLGYNSKTSVSKIRLSCYPTACLAPVKQKVEALLKPFVSRLRHSVAFYELGRDLDVYKRVKENWLKEYQRLLDCLVAGHEPRVLSVREITYGPGKDDQISTRSIFHDDHPQEAPEDSLVLREVLISYLREQIESLQRLLTKETSEPIIFETPTWERTPDDWYAEEAPATDMPKIDEELSALRDWWVGLTVSWENQIQEAWGSYQSGEVEARELPAPKSEYYEERRRSRISPVEEIRRAESEERFALYCAEVRKQAESWDLALPIISSVPIPETEDGFLINGLPIEVKSEWGGFMGTSHKSWDTRCVLRAERYESGNERSYIVNGLRWDMLGQQAGKDGSVEFFQIREDEDGVKIPARWSNKPINRETLLEFARDKGVDHQVVGYFLYFLPSEQARTLFQEISQIALEELKPLAGRNDKTAELKGWVEKWGTDSFDQLWNTPCYLETEDGKRHIAQNGEHWYSCQVSYKPNRGFVSVFPAEGTRIAIYWDNRLHPLYTRAIAGKAGIISVNLPYTGSGSSISAVWVHNGQLVQSDHLNNRLQPIEAPKSGIAYLKPR